MFIQKLSNLHNKKGGLHHAWLIEGGVKTSIELEDFLEKELNFKISGNPDFWKASFDTFGIDDARELRDRQSKKSLAGSKKIFIIETNFMTVEAQNSLLKIFEEPTEDTHFFMIMPSSENILPTLKSRLMIIDSESKHGSDYDIELFLSSHPSKRLDILKKTIEDKDKMGAINFLNKLEKHLRDSLSLEKVSEKEMFVFEEIAKMRSYLSDRSSSVKMILEHVCFVL